MESSTSPATKTTSESTSAPQPPPPTPPTTTLQSETSRNKMDTNDDIDDEEETSSSMSSTNGKLKIDIGEDSSSGCEKIQTVSSKKMRTKTPEKPREAVKTTFANSGIEKRASTETSKQHVSAIQSRKSAEVTVEEVVVTAANTEATEASATSSSEKKTTPGRRTINRGLDGGYWSRIGTEAAAAAAESSTSERRKRQRVTTERLDLSSFDKHNQSGNADESMMSADDSTFANTTMTTAASSLAGDLDSEESEFGKTASALQKRTSTSPPQRQNRLFKAKSFLTVRNESDGFYLCRAVNAVYEESKKCKVQWLEDVDVNKYTFSVVDYIQPMTIIAKVSVKRCLPSDQDHDKAGGAKGLISIEEKDLERVKKLLEKIKETGHLTMDSSELEDSSDHTTNSDEASDKVKSGTKKATKFFENDEFFDKEESETNLHDSEKNKQKPKSDEKIKKKKLNDETSVVAVKKKKLSTSPTPLAKKKNNDGNDTDHLETSSDNDEEEEEEEKKTSKKKSSKKSPTKTEGVKMKKPMAAPLAPPPSSTTVNASTNANALMPQNKKRRLVKVMSNRLLEENANVKVYVKDPFFEDMSPEIKLPFISAYVQSKLAFKAIYLNDTKMLKHLIDDRERVASVHIGKAVYNKWIPAEYAVYMENQKALELLIDDFVSKLNRENNHGVKRTQMPDSMFERFTSTGNYNPRSLGGMPFVRKLTESRGVKEGNNAFTKDQETLALVQNGSSRCVHTFFKRLFDLAFEYGSSIEMFDFLMTKWKSLDMNQKASFDIYSYTFRYIYENIISIIVFGHRKLAAHVLENAPAGTGFNAVHIEVLNVDNDAELKCLLRANMCTKKPFANDLVTPIHCASINPNVKYLKTLLSITQDFNIADKRGRKPVHFAAVCEGPSPLEYLISRVSPYELDHAGNTPLHYACLANRSMNVEILLNFAQKKQEDDAALTSEMLIDNKYGLGGLNKPNKRGQLPIHLAISRNSYKCVSILLKYGCNVEYPLPNSMGKITPLMYACQLGHYKIVKLLIENNAKVEARDRFQRTAIIHAAMCGHVRPLTHLLNMGANPNVVDSSGNSCLHYACAYGWYYAMRAILDAGGHVNVANDWKLTPFGVAFLKGHVGICDQLLLMHKNQIDINFRTEDGETLVMLSVSSTNCFNEASIEQLNYIVNKLGGNSQLVDAKGNNAFHYLAANKIDKSYFTAAVVASVGSETDKAVEELEKEQERFRYKMADLLLRSGCDPNAQNNELETSLYTAIACGNYKFARYLLTKKDTNCKITSQQNPNGKTILSLMADKCFEMDVGFIIFGDGGGGDSDENLASKYAKEFETMAKIKDENGQTPFQIACIKLNEYLARNTNYSHVLPVSLVRFIKFLYKDCKSNPNEVIQSKKVKQDGNNPSTFQPIKAARVQMATMARLPGAPENDDGAGDENDAGPEEATKQEMCTPTFKLIDDKCVDLIEDLFSISNDSSLNLVKIDFNYYDSHGMTPLLKSIALKQTKFALKLIEIFSKNYSNTDELANQICKNSLAHLNENIIQLCIRHDQFLVFNKIIDLMCSSEANSANLYNMLKHKNVYFQNILHVFASLDKNLKGHFLNGNFLNEFAQKISTHFSKAVGFAHRKNVLLHLALSSDKIGRNPLHLCLLNSDQNRVHVDLEIFFAEQMFNYCVDETDDPNEVARLKNQFFSDKDFFGRLPLHYLFYNLKQFDINTFNTANIYSLKNLYSNNGNDKLTPIYFGNNAERNQIPVIDPVELLTILLNNTEKKFYDEKDIYGYTPLHYAAMRGSTISCSLLVSKSCNFLSRSLISNSDEFKDSVDASLLGNTPLSTAIYFKRESCVLAFLRNIEKKNKSIEDNNEAATLRDYYYLHPQDVCGEDEIDNASKNKKERNLEWTSSFKEKNLYPTKRLPLYQLILSYKWEGISWLILGDLEAYGLDYFESIVSSILSFEFNLALRLVEKLQRKMNSQIDFLNCLTVQSKSNSHRTLLHVISNLDLTNHQTQKPALIQILERLFQVNKQQQQSAEVKQRLNAFLLVKDAYGSTALHYACCMHNFEIIDFVLGFNTVSMVSHLTSILDSNQQSAYALLFWRIGRGVYSKEAKEKIKAYTFKHVLNQSACFTPADNCVILEKVSKAYFPFVSTTDFKSEESSMSDSKLQNILSDYPPLNCSQQQFVSPLLYAINRQSFDMCKFLLKDLGFDVNTTDANRVNSLAYAVQTNNINLCKLLLNIDFDTTKKASTYDASLLNNTQNKATSRMKVLFTSIKTKTINNNDEDDCNSSDSCESETDEKPLTPPPPQFDILEQENIQVVDQVEKFEVKSNLTLNHLDAKQRSIFHHLACSLQYGSFQNTDICKLLFNAFNQLNLKLPALGDFLKRVDSNIRTASEYAILNGNIELYEEFAKILNKSTNEPSQLSKLSKFSVNDKIFTGIRVDFSKDADLFLNKYSNATNGGATTNGSHAAENDYFKVDPLSNMNKIGCLVWDQKANIPYDIILTKTDVSYGLYGMHNFYKMQLITHSFNHHHLKSKTQINDVQLSSNGNAKKFDQNQMCVLFTRWGRIGDPGQYQRTPFSNFQEAKDEFCKIFKQKTGNDFIDTVIDKKKPFENKPRRYNLVKFESRIRPKLKDINFDIFEVSGSSKQSLLEHELDLFDKSVFKKLESSNDYRLFWSDLLDVNFLKLQISQKSKLSASYLPLTQLSIESIKKASDILEKHLKPLIERRMELEKLSKKGDLGEYMTLLDKINKYSNDFYELIPQMNYNYEKLVPISNERELDAQFSTLNQLINAQIACRILMGAKYALSSSQTNPFDYVYHSIKCKLEWMNPNEHETKYILRYIWTDKNPKIQIKSIFKFERPGEQERFDKEVLSSGLSKLKNRILLWHGTGTENLLSIMSKGLLIAPNDAKWTGQRFGPGIYFSDSFANSAKYGSSGKYHSTGDFTRNYMLLCEVAMGKVKELRSSFETTESLPPGFDSVKAFGRREPDPNNNVNMPNGCIIPLGEKQEYKCKPGEGVYHRNNEQNQYIIYNESQVCIRYIVQYSVMD